MMHTRLSKSKQRLQQGQNGPRNPKTERKPREATGSGLEEKTSRRRGKTLAEAVQAGLRLPKFRMGLLEVEVRRGWFLAGSSWTSSVPGNSEKWPFALDFSDCGNFNTSPHFKPSTNIKTISILARIPIRQYPNDVQFPSC